MTRPHDLGSNAKACLLAALLSTSGLMTGAVQAGVLYSNDFSSTGLPNATAAFTVDTGAGVLNYEATAPAGQNPVATASAQVAGLGSLDFVVSTTFTLNATGTTTGNNSSIGFGLFGANDAFGGAAATPYYLADFNINGPGTGQMRIIPLPARASFTSANGSFPGAAVAAGETYEFRLAGSYSDGTLAMTLQMYDESGNLLGTTTTATDTSPLTGQFFGYRNRLVGSSGTTSISYHDFNVVEIPEPTSIALLVVAAVWLGTRATCMVKRT